MLDFACPGCSRKLRVKEDLAGRKAKCPHCACALTVPAIAAALPTESRSPSGAEPAEDPTVPPQADAPRDTSSEADATNGPAGGPANALTDFLAPPQGVGEIGRLGPYRVLKVLGAGGMGVVFQAEDPSLGRLVALKAMLPALAASASARQRFVREARAAAAVEHDHIVAVYQVGEDRGVPYLAMPFLRGEPLDQRIKREKRLPLAEVFRIGKETATGLEAARQRGMIHRDIKPANLWLEEGTGRVKILDFGLARAADDAAGLTQQGAILGTPAYMAPEQAGGKPDHRADLFSLGVVLYRLATGELPFKGADTISTLMAVATEPARPPQEINPGLPPGLSDLILRLLAKKPEDRPASAQAVVEALRVIEAQPAAPRRKSKIAVADRTTAEAPPKPTKPPKPVRRGPGKLWLGLAAVVGLVLVGGGGAIAYLLMHPPAVSVDSHPLPPKAEEPIKEGFGGTVAGYQSLFNGKDLTGWSIHHSRLGLGKADKDNWGVERGVLYTHGADRTWLVTDNQYGDFEMRLEYKTSEKTNSGVAIRAPLEGDLTFTALEVQIQDDAFYKNVKLTDTTGSLWGVVPANKPSPKPPGEWNLMHIMAKGREVRVDLNGKTVLEADLDRFKDQANQFPGVLRTRGYIGLQSHTNRAEFRNLEVRTLASDEYGRKQ
jgi:serine/threonine protein kinase